jgi:predicted nucleotidyltransferase
LSLRRLIEVLADGKVKFVIVGMVAGNLHGSQFVTEDLDLVYDTSTENVERLTTALASLEPRVAEQWPLEGSEGSFTPQTLATERSTTVITSEGEIDLLARIDGVGEYDEVVKASEDVVVDGRAVRVISLQGLIETKRASGREKDRLHLPELELIQELKAINQDDQREQP